MPTELEELVGFLGSDRAQIRQVALDHLVGYSAGPQANIFTPEGLQPVKDLKVLAADIASRAKNALTILINLCDNAAVQKDLADDEKFVELLLSKIASTEYSNCDEIAMLLANLTKQETLAGRLVRQKRSAPKSVSDSEYALDQLMDCFVKGAENKLNPKANFDYLAYVFANLSSTAAGRQYFVTRQDYDGVIPIQKLVVFTEHKSNVRRKGAASTIKNCCFEVPAHPMLLEEDGVNLLPYIILPIMGPEDYSVEDMDGMPEEVQLLPPDKERDSDNTIILTHLESLLLLTTTRFGRDYLREKKLYPIVRETHIAVQDEAVEEACDRLVQMLMRDEATDDAEEDKVVEIL